MSYYRESENYRQVERYSYKESGALQRDYVRTDVQITRDYGSGSQAPAVDYGSSSSGNYSTGASGWKTYDGTKDRIGSDRENGRNYDSTGDSHTGQCAYRHYLRDGGVKPSKK